MTEFETRDADWLSYSAALARVLAGASPLPSELVPFQEAVGRASATDIEAPRPLPEHDNSGMDGYAARAADFEHASLASPVELPVVAESLPGAPWSGTLSPGEAVRIMTGAAVPNGADSVVRVEHTDGGDQTVRVTSGSDAHRNVRPAGEDMQAGDVVVARGATLSPGHVAVLTSTGHIDVAVPRRPRVAILSTGDELVSTASLRTAGHEARDALWSNRIVDSNTPMLEACIRDAGGLAHTLGIARDDRESLGRALDSVGDVDALVTTGGASMGTHDLLKRVLDERSFRLAFWRVRIRPGSPVSLGFLPVPESGDLPVFGLPGNPASAFVTFELFVRPYLRALGGHSAIQRRQLRASAGSEIRGARDLDVFLRASVAGTPEHPVAHLTGPQGSGLVSSLGLADGLVRLEEGVERVAPGDPVNVLLLRSP